MPDNLVSLDEYLHSKGAAGVLRKEFARDNGVVLKGVPAAAIEKAGSFDKEKGSRRFVMSAEVEDRDRDIVKTKGIDLKNFLKNPVGPWAHRSYDPPCCTWSDVQKVEGRPNRLEGDATAIKGEPLGDRLLVHLELDTIRACSIGFMPTEIERREVPEDKKDTYFYPGYMIHACELYECSPCSIPANPAALAKAAASGDKLSREILEEVLDTWTMKDGLIMPKHIVEEAQRTATGERTTVVIGEKTFIVAGEKDGVPVLEAPPAPEPDEDGVVAKTVTAVLKAFGITPKAKETEKVDPAPEQDGVKPAAEPTPETKAMLDQMEKDLGAHTAFATKSMLDEGERMLTAVEAEMADRKAAA